MAWKLFREFVILTLSLVVGAILVAVSLRTGTLKSLALVLAAGELSGRFGAALVLELILVSPYLAVQAVRSYFWARRSATGKKWANLYVAILCCVVAGWFLAQAADLLVLMYELGDFPKELPQFFRLEAGNLLVGVGCLVLALVCFRGALDPRRTVRKT